MTGKKSGRMLIHIGSRRCGFISRTRNGVLTASHIRTWCGRTGSARPGTVWRRKMDSNLYGAFPCQVVVFGLLRVLWFGARRPAASTRTTTPSKTSAWRSGAGIGARPAATRAINECEGLPHSRRSVTCPDRLSCGKRTFAFAELRSVDDPSRLQPLVRKPVGADIEDFTSSAAIDRWVNWLLGIADDRPDLRRPMP